MHVCTSTCSLFHIQTSDDCCFLPSDHAEGVFSRRRSFGLTLCQDLRLILLTGDLKLFRVSVSSYWSQQSKQKKHRTKMNQRNHICHICSLFDRDSSSPSLEALGQQTSGVVFKLRCLCQLGGFQLQSCHAPTNRNRLQL